MAIAKCASGVFLQRAFIRSIWGEADVQIVTAASLNVTDLEHHCVPLSHLTMESAADDVLLLLSCQPHEIDGVA